MRLQIERLQKNLSSTSVLSHLVPFPGDHIIKWFWVLAETYHAKIMFYYNVETAFLFQLWLYFSIW